MFLNYYGIIPYDNLGLLDWGLQTGAEFHIASKYRFTFTCEKKCEEKELTCELGLKSYVGVVQVSQRSIIPPETAMHDDFAR